MRAWALRGSAAPAAVARTVVTARRLAVAWLVAMSVGTSASAAQTCATVPDDAFAFISSSDEDCPADPGVRWTAATVVYDCGFFADTDKTINCSGDAATCIELCKTAANVWNTDLPGRFSFVEATDPITFCDPADGRVSVGGSRKLCDGTTYGRFTLAVTLSRFFNAGPQVGELIDANITINQGFSFSQASFRATLAHEFGHVLGLAHPDQCAKNFDVLMRSSERFLSTDPCFVRDPTQADINGAERIYPITSTVPTPTPTPTPGSCGDADLSGAVTVTDGVQALRAAAELSSPCTLERCDMDGNGVISVSDGVHILRGAAGLAFNENCP